MSSMAGKSAAVIAAAIVAFILIPGVAHSQAGTWQLLDPMPTPRYAGAFRAIDGKLYAYSGHLAVSSQPSLEVFDPATGTWTSRSHSPVVRSNMGAAAVGNVLYVIGGMLNSNSQTSTNLVEAYDAATDTWSTKAPMPTVRYGVATGVINGEIYVAGGGIACDPCVPQPTALEVYNPANDSWSARAPLPTPRSFPVGEVVGGKLYVIGGLRYFASSSDFADSGIVEIYDPATNSWSTGAPMPTARSAAASAVIDGRIHVVGGLNQVTGTALATHEVYDPATDSWSTSAPMNVPRWGLMAEAIGSQLYASGGIDAAGSITSFFEMFTAPPVATTIAIDIKPGSDPNTINLGSAGVVPVAMLSSATFDATQVAPETVTLAGAGVRLIGRGSRFACYPQDVNHDGRLDLVCHVETAQFLIEPGSTVAELTASTFGGRQVRGADSIHVVP